MAVNYKSMLKNVPVQFKEKVEQLSTIAYVKYVETTTIEAYSPIFKDITVHANNGTMGCKRGDQIKIRLSRSGYNYFELVENTTLKNEIKKFEDGCFYPAFDAMEEYQIRKWRDAQLKNQKQR